MKKRFKVVKWLAIGITSVGIIVLAVILTMYCTHHAQVESKINDFKQTVEQLQENSTEESDNTDTNVRSDNNTDDSDNGSNSEYDWSNGESLARLNGQIDVAALKRDSLAYNEALKQNQNLRLTGDNYIYAALDLTKYGIYDNIYGYVSAPTIGMELPIYLGVNDDTMGFGAGHLCMPKDFDPSEEYYQQLRAKAGYYNKYSYEETPVLRVRVGDHDVEDYKDINKAIKIIRYKYWNHLFHNEKFTELLTSDMRQKLYNAVSSMDVYDFNAHNIQVVQEQFITSLLQNLEQTILSLFEELTCEHTYFDGSSNIHYYNGWKSNKAHKVNKRVVIPMYGVFDDWKYSSDIFHCYELENRMCDIEKVFNYLSDGTTVGASIKSVVYYANQQHKNRNLHFKYFDASIFKKGTCHLKFTDEAVVDALNIYVGKHKGWLPPSYGKVSYDEMNAEEQAVIDDFQGKEQYAKVLANPSKYLFETSAMLALPSGQSNIKR